MSDGVQRRVSYRLRRALGPVLDRAMRTVTDETIRVYPSGYAGTVHTDIDRLESVLSEHGFSWNPVSMYHYTRLGKQTNGSWVSRESPFADRQLHAVLVRQDARQIDVYAHEENNWRRHPLKHVRDAGIDREAGSERMRAILDDLDLDYRRESYVRRKVGHLGQRVRTGLARLASR
ncbi:hypothetical protein C475_13877 [Halosimplex carlsbadense 2-9-1]|uniref:Uncharacterized protein n=1 Tax=Halosimplex carlsbadense 2-9-1 TaxID=797114 RepID=M0CNX2_9EURY|nr:hypothetical protein [Halosimplex carlsbadense]ELZ24343.1 hypothetical protein C475_13877 [Halosimplex carlsbadense 2-9-1]